MGEMPRHPVSVTGIVVRGDGRILAIQRKDDGLGCGHLAGCEQRRQLGPLLGEIAGMCRSPGAPTDTDRIDVVEQ